MMSGDSRQAPDFSQSIPAGSQHFNFGFNRVGLLPVRKRRAWE